MLLPTLFLLFLLLILLPHTSNSTTVPAASYSSSKTGQILILPEIIITIAAHYSPRRIAHLHQTLETLNTYTSTIKPPKVFIITSDKTKTLSKLLKLDPSPFSNKRYQLFIQEPRDILSPGEELMDPHRLTWLHRRIFEREFRPQEQEQIFMYLEDDINVPFGHLVNWWKDADALYESENLVSSFYRVDGDPEAPSLGFLTDQFKNCEGEIWDVRQTMVSLREDAHFVQLWNPYSACYALTTTMMRDFINSDEWDLEYLASTGNVMGMDVREVAASGMMFTNLKKALPFDRSTAVVPFDKESGALKVEGAVYHMDISKEEVRKRFCSNSHFAPRCQHTIAYGHPSIYTL